jgi:hypothetical protein
MPAKPPPRARAIASKRAATNFFFAATNLLAARRVVVSTAPLRRRGVELERDRCTERSVRRYGTRRARLKGHDGAQTTVGWGVLAYNLDTLAIRAA